MPNWERLRAAILRDDANARRLALIEQIEKWLNLPVEQALEACAKAATTEDMAREVNGLLNLVMAAQRRDLDIADGPAGVARFQELITAYQAGTLEPAVRHIWERYAAAFRLWLTQREAFPAITTTPPPEPERGALAALQTRQLDAEQYTGPGGATAERMEVLVAVLADYRALASTVARGRQIFVDICFFAGHTAYALARGWSILGRTQRAARLYAEEFAQAKANFYNRLSAGSTA
jgi:hypothetical protein